MMAEIIAAIDEGGTNVLLADAMQTMGVLSDNGSSSLGPFTASYSVRGQFTSGAVDLIAPSTVRIDQLHFDWHVDLGFEIDLNSFLPHFCLPQVCIDIPCVGKVCTPRICVSWGTVGVNVPLEDFIEATADCGLDIRLDGGIWKVQVVVQNVSQLQFGPATAGMLVVIGLAITPVLLAVPFIGPFLAIAVNAILAAIGLAGVTGFLGPILSPFISGLKIPVYKPHKHFEVLPASGIDPAVFVEIDAVAANVRQSDEDELVLSIDISSP
jgi:hypothetical protein